MMLRRSRCEICPLPIGDAVSAAISTSRRFCGLKDSRYSRIRVWFFSQSALLRTSSASSSAFLRRSASCLSFAFRLLPVFLPWNWRWLFPVVSQGHYKGPSSILSGFWSDYLSLFEHVTYSVASHIIHQGVGLFPADSIPALPEAL